MTTIQLQSSDKEIFEVEESIANQSVVIRHLLEVQEVQFNGDKILISLENIKGRVLRMVIEWIVKHVDGELNEEQLRRWESEFVNLDMDALYELIMAANYLELTELLDRACRRVADIITGKQPDEIRGVFGIENDLSLKEETEIRRQHAWAFENPAKKQ